MSGVWKSLLPAAMVGTERAPAWSAQAPGAVGALLREVEQGSADPALRLLRAAGVIAACAGAAVRGEPPVAAVEAAADEARPALADAGLQAQLAWVLREGPARLQQHALQRLAARGWRLPVRLLPLALDLGRCSQALREPLLGVLGERGSWLARQRADWRFASGVGDTASDEQRWALGSLEQRREWLLRQRRATPGAARERLAAEWFALPARERAELLGVLAQQLAAEDEPWLASLLADRSREVRQVAAGLLLRLPDSAFVRRAGERLAPWLRQERVLLRRKWCIDAPEAAQAPWEREGIELTRPQHESLGERAWWLYQLARQVPVGWWCEHTGLAPAELFSWGSKSEWAEALLRAWRDVLLHTAEAQACDALLEGWPWKGLGGDPARLMALLPPALRERHWLRQLTQGAAATRGLLAQLPAACPPGESLSLPLSKQLLPTLEAALRDPSLAYDYALRAALPEVCGVLHADALAMLGRLAARGDETPAHAELLATVARVIAARRAFDQLPTAPTRP
jgi:hypothetical protein